MNDALIQRIRQCPNLPTLPSIAIEVLDLAQSADADIAEIARVISKDPALSTKILKTVNSSFYGRSQNVATISNALVILGLQSVKTLVLGFSLVSNIKSDKQSDGFNHLSYWKRSIYSATAARSICARLNCVQQEEAFLAALLADIGMLVLDAVLGPEYGALCANSDNHAALVQAEAQQYQLTHAEVGGLLAEQWRLPPLLSTPIGMHHSTDKVSDMQLRMLTDIVALAGQCADVYVNQHAAEAISIVRQHCMAHDISEADADALLDEIGQRTKETASLFEINIGGGVDFETILRRANETLVELTLASQQQATQLEAQNQKLKEQATTDALTGLANRARFDQFIKDKFDEALAKAQPLALLMMDVDKFKSVNDKHGHPAGDAVLKAVGKLLRTATRTQDLAARYGGEEMALILPNTSRATAAAVAETVRRSIAAKPINIGGAATLPITASIGVAVFEPNGPFKTFAHLIKAADLAVYNAKHCGRNCVKVFAIKPATKVA